MGFVDILLMSFVIAPFVAGVAVLLQNRKYEKLDREINRKPD